MFKLNKISAFLLSITVFVLSGLTAYAGPTTPGSGSPTTPGALCLDDADTWILCEPTFTFGDASAAIANGNFTSLTVGTLTVSGITMAGNLDMDGYNIVMDTDGDSAFVNDRDVGILDDEIGINLNGAADFLFQANTFNILAGSGLHLADDAPLRIGNTVAAPDASLAWNTTQTVDGLYLATATAQNTLLVAEQGDIAFDFAHAAATNPTMFVHSATQSTTQWLSLAHNQTNAVFDVGTGGFNWNFATVNRMTLTDDATFDTMLKIMDTTATPLETHIGHFADSASFPRTYIMGGQDATDTNWGLRFSHKNSSSAAQIPVIMQITSNNNTSYTNAESVNLVAGTTTNAGHMIYTGTGSAADGLPLYIGTEASGVLADLALKINTVATGQGIEIWQRAVTSGTPKALLVTSAAHTGLTASTEDIGINFNLSADKTWAAGLVATQREVLIQAPTYTTATFTTAATFAVSGAPSGTITNAYSIWAQAGVSAFAGGIIGGTQTALGTGYLLDLKNSSSANVTMATTNSNSAGFAQMALFNNSGDSSVIDVFGSTYVTAAFQRNTLLGAGRSLYITSNSSGGLSTATINLYTGGNPATPEFTMAGPVGNATFSALASTSGSPTVFTITAPAHTTLAASTEATDVNINLARTVQFNTGALTNQRAFRIQAPTYGFVGASTMTSAATFVVGGAPLEGTNATISFSKAMVIEDTAHNAASGYGLIIEGSGIANGAGAITTIVDFAVGGSPFSVSLGNETSTLTNLYRVFVDNDEYDSTTNVRTVSNVGAASFSAPSVVVGSSLVTMQNIAGVRIDNDIHEYPSLAALNYKGLDVGLGTITVTGTTGMTATVGVSGVNIGIITVTDASVATMTAAASLYVEGAVAQAGSLTITNKYAMWVDAGSSRFDGDFVMGSKGIDTTAGDSATVNGIAGRFRKDATGTTFTLTNSFITANSIIQLTYASDPGITGFDAYVVAGAGSATITFTTSGVAAAPTNSTDINFFVAN